MDDLFLLFFSFYFIGCIIALFSIYAINKTLEESERFELHLALVVSSLSYVFLVMLMLDILDKKFQSRLPLIKKNFVFLYEKLNKKFMGLK